MSSLSIDLNCDMGESFGNFTIGNDEALLQYVSSANIACGFHAGDPAVMRKTVGMAIANGVAVGAHPGLPDLQGFGRREMAVKPEEVYEFVLYQVGALMAFTRAEGAALRHVKPHGALYNMAAVNSRIAEAIAEAVYKTDPALVLYGLAGSRLIDAGRRAGLRTAQEVFADRSYQQDGTLTPRSQPDALITAPEAAANQVLEMVRHNKVTTLQGTQYQLQPDTVCIHGDGPHALEFAQNIYQKLQEAGIEIKAIED
ncbi:LamB/YcsF family protein [Cesiribacter sp. SM1]|uniref:LamB/YcsF family protein n=1 Tax=Cesiribacter sp. SM1 TaxID=2861196 RepID=UPI001CD8151E|nr:5-oxoprolinase subunit PxpA [Cesiribacter sp. SM1]